MKKMIRLSALLFLLSTMYSCKKELDPSKFDGSYSQMEDFVGKDIMNALNDFNFSIYTGKTPPNIEGQYTLSPFVLKESTVAGDVEGSVFDNYYMHFYNQEGLNLQFKGGHDSGQSGKGSGAIIAGSDDNFTVLLKVVSTYRGYDAVFVYAVSGTKTSNGLKDLHFANLMLDDKGDEGGFWIENNTGRCLYDSDGFSN